MTRRNFGQMLNEVLSLKLMRNSYLRDTYIMRKTTDRDQSWKGGPYIVPFEAGESSNYRSGGGLVPKADIEQDQYIRGSIPGYKKVHGSVIFYDQDRREHGRGARVPQDTFYKNVIGNVLMRNRARFQFMWSHVLLNGGAFVRATGNGSATGVVQVDHPERLTINQKVHLVTRTGAAGAAPTRRYGIEAWVSSIDINSRNITLVTRDNGGTAGAQQFSRAGSTRAGSVLNLTNLGSDEAATPAVRGFLSGDGIFLPGDAGSISASITGSGTLASPAAAVGGVVTAPAALGPRSARDVNTGTFTSLASQILPGSHDDGSDTLFGVNKSDYPYLQAIAEDASGAANLSDTRIKVTSFLDRVFDTYTNLIQKGQASAKAMNETGQKALSKRGPMMMDCVVSLQWFALVQKFFLRVRGTYFKATSGGKVPFYDAESLVITGPDQTMLRIIGVKSMRHDLAYFIGDNTLRFASNNFIYVYESPDGNKFYTIRDDDNGYSWICDYVIYGDLILKRPAGCAVLYGLPNPTARTGLTFDYSNT